MKFFNQLFSFSESRATAIHPNKGIAQVCKIVKEARGLVKVRFSDGVETTINKAQLINGKIK